MSQRRTHLATAGLAWLLCSAICGVSWPVVAQPGAGVTSAPAPLSLADLLGNWEGRYRCGQGEIRARLFITRISGDSLQGHFSFYPTQTNPSVPRGAYRVTGQQVEASGEIEITPGAWLQQPPGYASGPIRGSISRLGDRDVFIGAVLASGCGEIELSKPANSGTPHIAAPAVPAATAPPPSNTPPASQLSPDVIGVWEGEYQCGTGQRPLRADATLTIRPGGEPATLRVTGLSGAAGAQAPYLVAFDAALGSIRLNPASPPRRADQAHELAITALLSADRQRISGRFEGRRCETIELTRVRDTVPPPLTRVGTPALQASATDDACDAVALWARRLFDEYPAERMRTTAALANLTREEHFRSHIGAEYSALDRAGFQRLGAIRQRCIQRGLLDAPTVLVSTILTGQNANQLTVPLQAQAAALEWRARALDAAERVPAIAEGVATLARFEGAADQELAALWPSERRAVRETLAQRRQAVVEAALVAIAGRDPDATLPLDQIAALHHLAGVAADAGAPVRARVDRALARHLEAAFAAIGQFPATEAGRASFQAWRQSLDQDVSPYADYPAVRAARARFPGELQALNDRIDLAFVSNSAAAPSLERLLRLGELATTRPANVADPARVALDRELAQLTAARVAESARFEESAAGLARFNTWVGEFTRDFSRYEQTPPVREAQQRFAQRRVVLEIAAAAEEQRQIRQAGRPDLARLIAMNDRLAALRAQLPLAGSSEAERRLAGVEAALAGSVSEMIAAEAEVLRGSPATSEGLQRIASGRSELALRYARFVALPAYRQAMEALQQREGAVVAAILRPAIEPSGQRSVEELAALHERVLELRALTGSTNVEAEAAYARADAAIAEGVRSHLSRVQASLRNKPRTPEGLVQLATESNDTIRQFARLTRHPAYQEVVRGVAEQDSAQLNAVRSALTTAVEGSTSPAAVRAVRLSIEAVEGRVTAPVRTALWEAYNAGLSPWLVAQMARIPEAARTPTAQSNLMGSFGQQQAAAAAPPSLLEVCQQANLSNVPERYCACAGPVLEQRLDAAQQAFLRRNPAVTLGILVEVLPRLDADIRQCASAPPPLRACSSQELAGAYDSNPGGLRCNTAGSDRLTCCYGEGCRNQMALQLGQGGRSLTGTYSVPQTRDGGDVELGVTADCAITSGRWSWTTVFMGRPETNWRPFQVLGRTQIAETERATPGGSVPAFSGLLGSQATGGLATGAIAMNFADFERSDLLRALMARDVTALISFRAGLLPENHGIPQGLIIYLSTFNGVLSQIAECVTLMPAGLDAELQRVLATASLQPDRGAAMAADLFGRMAQGLQGQNPREVPDLSRSMAPLVDMQAVRGRLESEGRRDALLFLQQTNCDGPAARALADGARALMNHFRTLR